MDDIRSVYQPQRWRWKTAMGCDGRGVGCVLEGMWSILDRCVKIP